ncbi:hypothetical protein FOA52_006832 [Chlamydomonas sp. UWO 241]|nr:hypothetical protein FOA52_006832 [Chlamydomonas sp. UWO 241]
MALLHRHSSLAGLGARTARPSVMRPTFGCGSPCASQATQLSGARDVVACGRAGRSSGRGAPSGGRGTQGGRGGGGGRGSGPSSGSGNSTAVASPTEVRVSKKKSKKQVDINGDVAKDLGNGMFNVKLENGVSVMAHLSGKIRQNRIKIVMGDKVTVELSPYDLTKGRITYRFRPGEYDRLQQEAQAAAAANAAAAAAAAPATAPPPLRVAATTA